MLLTLTSLANDKTNIRCLSTITIKSVRKRRIFFSGKLVPSSLFSQSSEDVWSFRLKCATENSTDISDCNLDEIEKVQTNCTDLVSVWCFNAVNLGITRIQIKEKLILKCLNVRSFAKYKIRDIKNSIILTGGDAPNQGRVEIFNNNTIGTICDDHFDNQAADVTCTMIGYR
ncbi:hypothetical protein KUTeg_010148 [Tegillarca granosa]|uniref:SRCR domain-containing protein n=1 Tax=Tegillarca granosa TaxID=220873 RepID=A0ABQ9F915_TEGGR|nr:hypothetical protein KUTeg_010148 [Tegillarca granosa]